MARNHDVQLSWRRIMRLLRFARLSQPTRQIPKWCVWSVAANLAGAGAFAGVVMQAQIRPSPGERESVSANTTALVSPRGRLTTVAQASRPDAEGSLLSDVQPGSPSASSSPSGPRHRLDYQDWLILLEKEAIAASQRQPDQLTVLLGDSISLWFPPKLLPSDRSWLNQGISGEISSGLLKRLDLIDETDPETILVMIGINDLIQDVGTATLLANYRLILENLQESHPRSDLVVQSILPHAGGAATWEGKARLLEIPNDDIRDINRDLEAIAEDYDAQYLDLYPIFADADGNLRPELTTDGLHLNDSGYLVWSTALQLHSRE
ncbi:MAG: GDSL-type esterase/lipase family protein [Elainellaceae cyanobacterium]